MGVLIMHGGAREGRGNLPGRVGTRAGSRRAERFACYRSVVDEAAAGAGLQASSRKMRRPKPVFTFFCIIDLMSAWYLPGTVITPALPHCNALSSLSSVAGSKRTCAQINQ